MITASVKNAISGAACAAGLVWLSERIAAAARPKAHIRAILYHDTMPADVPRLRDHFRYFARHYVPVGPEDLHGLLDGRWQHDRPGLIPCLDDGLRNHFDVALPIVEEFGFKAWLFVPAGLVEPESEDEQAKYIRFIAAHRSHDSNPCILTDWGSLRSVTGRHVVGCHTMTHLRLGPNVAPDRLDREVRGAKALMERQLDRKIEAFAWVGGEAESRSATAARAVTAAGFRFAFLTHKGIIVAGEAPHRLQRVALDASYSMSTVRYYLGGVPDLMARGERRRINRILAGNPTK